jgi:hypothetical protein
MTMAPHDVPTLRQGRTLLVLGSGGALVVGTRRDVGPLIRRGWVVGEPDPSGWAWVRITPAGLHALARSVERTGLPELLPKRSA